MEVKRAVLCARHGHPPVVDVCIGQVTCARCGAILGDTLMSTYPLDKCVVRNHDCPTCRQIWNTLTPIQRKLTPNPFKKEKQAVPA